MPEPVSSPRVPVVVDERTTFGWPVMLAIVAAVSFVVTAAVMARDTRDRLSTVETEHKKDQGDVSEIKGDVKVLNNNVGLLMRRWGMQPQPLAKDTP